MVILYIRTLAGAVQCSPSPEAYYFSRLLACVGLSSASETLDGVRGDQLTQLQDLFFVLRTVNIVCIEKIH